MSNSSSLFDYLNDPSPYRTRAREIYPQKRFIEETNKILTLLLEKGADANIVDGFGHTPLIDAIRRGVDPIIIETLLKYGTDPNRSTSGIGVE